MKYSLIIPARNGEKYLELALQSALDQTLPADEIIVVDDASTDSTAEIVHGFCRSVKYIYNETATGFVDAWNRAIEMASGDFVTILHHDDLLHPEYLEHTARAVVRYPLVRHFYSACNYIDESGYIIKSAPLPHSTEPILYSGRAYAHNYLMSVLSNQHIHRCPGVTTSRALLLNECSYRKAAGHIADDDFFYRVGGYTDVVGISFPLASFRVHSASETAKADLTEQLSADYVYQALQTKRGDCIFDDTDKQLILQTAVKFINEQLFYKLLSHDRAGAAKALANAREFEEIVSGDLKSYLPARAKLMWTMTEKNLVGFSWSYVHLLDMVRRLRDFMRKRSGADAG
jgi:glycosyltransferase involved in cell wall biosynthesis